LGKRCKENGFGVNFAGGEFANIGGGDGGGIVGVEEEKS
jgi:hypothetical protein